MKFAFNKSQIALAAIAAIGMVGLASAPTTASAAKAAGTYVTGDIHNHTTCSDGALSMQKLVKKSTGTVASGDGWGLDWFVQAGHGGSGTKNCTLTEDATLDTPAYPFVAGTTPATTWTATPAGAAGAVTPKGNTTGSTMWRWQSLQEFQYPVMEYLATLRDKPLFLGVESVVAGHEHSSMSIINGQLPSSLTLAGLPSTPNTTAGASRYTAVGNANLLAKWEYCFDRNDTDTSRGNTTNTSGVGNNWDCSFTGGLNDTSAYWNSTAKKLGQGSGNGTGNNGHTKTIEALKWMNVNAPDGSYYIPAHLERAGPFNANGNNGFNVEHLRNMNNAAPKIAFAMETQPGHGASSDRGEYKPLRQTINSVSTDSVGGTTYGGTGVYGAQIGGVWDALLGEGRNFWFSASSDWHNRGSFGADDRRSTQDFYPGEYQRMYVMTRNAGAKVTPQMIVDGMRTGNKWVAAGQLIDRMGFIACSSYPGVGARSNAAVQALAVAAATGNTDIDKAGCATMGEKLVMPKAGGEVVVSIVVRDPSGTNYSPYSFNNPSLAQISMSQPLNAPVLDHVDVIRGMVTGYKTPGAADYSGQWPANTDWLSTSGVTAGLSAVPAAAKNTSASVIKTFAATGGSAWTSVSGNTEYKAMTFRISAVNASQYVRLRGTNLPASVPYETDASGNPLADLFTNAGNTAKLAIPCSVTGGATEFDQCPTHMATASGASPITGQKAVSYDVAAWADLWFYSNPIYIQVTGSTAVAGVQ